MRYRELHIQTRRERPSRARTEGEGLLIRAGYLNSEGQPTELGERALARLRQRVIDRHNLLQELGLRTLRTADDEVIALGVGGDFRVLHCGTCGYAATPEQARARKAPLPAEPALPIERMATPGCTTIESLASFLGVAEAKTAKALLYARPEAGDLVFVVIRGDMHLSEYKLARAIGPLPAATHDQIMAAGAVPGYASPIGLRNAYIVVDDLIPVSANLVAGANEAGFHLLNTNYGRDYGADKVADLTLAAAGNPCTNCGTPLESSTGAWLGHRDDLEYSSVLGALAELHRDEHGLAFPVGCAAFDVHVLDLPSKAIDTKQAAADLHAQLEHLGVAVLLDDRDERAGVKFNDADLMGSPLRVTVGARQLKERMVEFKRRSASSSETIPIHRAAHILSSLINM